MRILLIDDDSTPKELLKKAILSKYPDTEFVTADDGQQGTDIYDSDKKFDVIFCDLIMPVKDGFGVVEYIRGTLGDKKIPIIMCTSKNSRKIVIKLIEAGATDYLTKPFDPARCIFKLERIINRKKAKEALSAIQSSQKAAKPEEPAKPEESERTGEEVAKTEEPKETAETEEAAGAEEQKEEEKPNASLKHGNVGADIIDDEAETQVFDLSADNEDDDEAVELTDEHF